MERKIKFSLWYVFLAIWGIWLVHEFISQFTQIENIPYSQFQQYLEAGNVAEVQVLQDSLRGKLKSPEAGHPEYFVSIRVDKDLAAQLHKHNVKFTGVIESNFLKELLSWIVPTLVFFGIWIFLMRKFAGRDGLGGSFMSIGKSKARVYVEEATKVTFRDVAGVEEAKDELKEIVEFLRDPSSYGRLGGRLPKGILLVGPPGTGKTLLARAVAGEAKVPFFSISGSEFVELFVGVGAARVRDLFEQARQKAPCIIFIDELDALGRARGIASMGGGHDEKEQTLNQLLVELDGFDSVIGVVLLAATNRPEILDPALLRAGRFDRQVLVDRPDKKGRIEILEVHVKKINLAKNISLEEVAALTAGFSGADLANLCNEAALLATRRKGNDVILSDFTAAIERIVAGLEKKNRILNSNERKVVAYHEMGHALVALGIPGTDPVHKVSIIPRGIGALGYTMQRPLEDRFLMSEEELENKMAVLLGGRAAEMLIFNRASTGASDDFSRVTDIARNMITRYGMGKKLGLVSYEVEPTAFSKGGHGGLVEGRLYSEETAREIDCEVRERVEKAFRKALYILSEKRVALERCANELLERETLTSEDLKAILGDSSAAQASPDQKQA